MALSGTANDDGTLSAAVHHAPGQPRVDAVASGTGTVLEMQMPQP